MKGVPLGDDALLMADDDNVATALDDLEAGREFSLDDAGRSADSGVDFAIDRTRVSLVEDVEFGHKFALEPIAVGEEIRKYGEVIGEATADIEPGEWVHTHNVVSTRGQPDGEQSVPADTADAGERDP